MQTGDMTLDQVRELVEARIGKPEPEDPDRESERPVGSPHKDSTAAINEVLLSGVVCRHPVHLGHLRRDRGRLGMAMTPKDSH